MWEKRYIILLVVSLCGFIMCGCGEQSKFIKQVKIVAEEQGLKDVSVTAKEDSYGYGLFEATVTSSNFDEFSPEEMLSIVSCIEDSIEGGIAMDYLCNGDKYYVSTATNRIEKNGEYDWYNDYENSEVHKSASSNKSNNEEITYKVEDSDEKVKCWILAEREVRKKLKSPSSAKFPFSASSEDVSIYKNSRGDKYYVSAWVEAENSYGAMIRSNFVVTLSYDYQTGFTVVSTVVN